MKGHHRQLKIEIFSPNYNIIFKEKLEYNSREMVYTNLWRNKIAINMEL